MLIQVLRDLEAGGIVERIVYQIVPPKTEYRLTALGKTIREPVSLLCEWADNHSDVIDLILKNKRKLDQ